MPVSHTKLKTLYIMKILLEKSDEDHVLSAVDLENQLKRYGFDSVDRKTIYNDIDTLREYGLDILQMKGAKTGYYLASRDFELPELKLLVDAVQSSKFITTKKSENLINKLKQLTCESEAKQLQRNVFIYNRPKAGNETIYYNVDKIHTAILKNKKIIFKYSEWTIQKELQAKKDGEQYLVSPWSLTWDSENYYLIAYDEKTNQIKHYRVDKMRQTELIKEHRVGKEEFKNFDLGSFAKKTFFMYGGRDEGVTLLCHNDLAGVIIDRFGKDVMIMPVGDNHFHVSVLVAVSPQFFGWVTGVGNHMHIEGPGRVKEEYKEYLQGIVKRY